MSTKIFSKWYFWAALAVVAVLVYMHRTGDTIVIGMGGSKTDAPEADKKAA